MTKLNAKAREGATLESAEGDGLRFAYRQLRQSTGMPLFLLQHFSGNIDAWDPANMNTLGVDRPIRTPAMRRSSSTTTL